ncbi:hypothetical protein F5887DRAFT_1215900 [Amanita rubescens]|nr:hypothetical protein F5887DRAFT_1215900 [Amanita rubescens]
MSKTFSITEHFQARQIEDLFEGPLSDVEFLYSDSEDEEKPIRAKHKRTGSEHAAPLSAPLYSDSEDEERPTGAKRKRTGGANHGAPLSALLYSNSEDEEKPTTVKRKRTGSANHAAPLSAPGEREGKEDKMDSTDSKHVANEPKHVAKKRRLEAVKDVILVDYSLPSDAQAQTTRPGWIGKRIAGLPQRVFSYTELINDYQMTRFPWDGLSTHLLLDKNGYIVGVLLGMPRDVKGWKEAQGMAFVALDKAADVICPRAKEASHRRGEFPSLPHGISFGGGQPEPQFLTHSSDASHRSTRRTSHKQRHPKDVQLRQL